MPEIFRRDSERSATVHLHCDLYRADAIAEAARLFADFAHFAVVAEGDHHRVEIREIDTEVEGDVVSEFCNFALANSASAERTVE